MRKLVPYEKEFVDFTEASEAGKYMLDKVAKSTNTKIAYSKACKFFSDYVKKGLDEIVAEYQTDVKKNNYDAFDKWERIFDKFAIHLKKDLNLGTSSVSVFHAGAKALINSSVPRSMRLQAKSPEVVSRTISGVTIEDLKEIYSIVNVRDRAIIAFLKDSGMSRADALTLNISDLEGFDKNEQFIHLNVFRGKEGVEYETFIGPNAVDALRAYFKWRQQNGEVISKDSPLFTTTRRKGSDFIRLNDGALNSIFWLIQKDTGKVISSHRLRKFFETYMALVVRHPIVLKYWMGHRVRKGSRDIESRYILPPTPEQLKLYKESYRNIDLTGGSLEERAKAAAREEFEKMLTPEQREFAHTHKIQLNQSRKLRPRKQEDDCSDGKHCQQIVTEENLAGFLDEGWKVVSTLPSGKIVIDDR